MAGGQIIRQPAAARTKLRKSAPMRQSSVDGRQCPRCDDRGRHDRTCRHASVDDQKARRGPRCRSGRRAAAASLMRRRSELRPSAAVRSFSQTRVSSRQRTSRPGAKPMAWDASALRRMASPKRSARLRPLPSVGGAPWLAASASAVSNRRPSAPASAVIPSTGCNT